VILNSSVSINIGGTIFVCKVLRPAQIYLLPNGENFCYNAKQNLKQNHQHKSKYLAHQARRY